MAIHLDPFLEPLRFYSSGKTFCMWSLAGFIGLTPDGTVQRNVSTSQPGTFFRGLGFCDEYVFTAKANAPYSVYRNDIVLGTHGQWMDAATAGVDIINDVACDGTHLYVAGVNSGGTQFLVSKFVLDGQVKLWTKSYAGYTGGPVGIAANPLGFIIGDNSLRRVYDQDGVIQSSPTVNDALFFSYAYCATRDRLFFADKTSGFGGIGQIHCYNAAGVHQWTINPPVPTDWDFAPAVTENHVFCWLQSSPTVSNNHAIVMPRTVVRDSNGNITSDTVNIGAAVTHDIGFSDPNYRKAAVNARSYLDF